MAYRGALRWWRAVSTIVVLFLTLSCTTAPTSVATLPSTAPIATPVSSQSKSATALPAIAVGGMFDLTGATAETARPYVDGVRRYLRQVNEQGGVNGRRVNLIESDYSSDVPKAVDAYKQLVSRDRIVAMIGWADLDTDALSPLLAEDKVPYLSAAYTPSLVARVAEHPYNFLIGASYADQMRVAIQYIKDNWHATDRPPNVAFLVAPNAFGRSPLPTARGIAAQLGFKIVAEEYLPYDASDAMGQLSTIRNKAADYIVVNDLTPPTAVALRDAASLGLNVPIITLNWAVDEELLRRAGPAAESLVGVTPFSFIAEDRPGFTDLRAAYHGVDGPDVLGVRQVQGWLTAKLLVAAIMRTGNKVSGAGIKSALEAFREFDTGGITAPLTWTKDDHANHAVKVYQVRGGMWTALSDFTIVDRSP